MRSWSYFVWLVEEDDPRCKDALPSFTDAEADHTDKATA
jgi:hypothetical protein